MPGCCADKSCKKSTCMTLPDGKTCGDCDHHKRCEMLFQCKPTNTVCDFFPRRFSLRVVA
jgi:hypothetical protein